jgi:endonuclease III
MISMRTSIAAVTQSLLEYSKGIDKEELFPTLEPEASHLIHVNPYAFTLATCLDRGRVTEVIWTIPYYIYQKLGHLDPFKIHAMSLDELQSLFYSLDKRPRYVTDAPRTVAEITTIIVDEHNGNAALIWKNKRAADVKRTFLSVHGVGEGIASMALLLIEKAYDIRFNDLDRRRMDIKADVHTMRVLHRLGMADKETTQMAIDAARQMHPEYSGELDAALWTIGRKWCFAFEPDCGDCVMADLCPKQDL